MNSPLGKYASIVAAVTAIAVIGAWIVAEFLVTLGIATQNPAGLKEVALIAVGAVFGSAVAVNGWKQPLVAAHDRIDMLETATGIPTHPPEVVTTPLIG